MNTRGECLLELELNGRKFQHVFRIVEEVEWDVLCGNDFIHWNKAKIDYDQESIQFANDCEVPIEFSRQQNYQEVRNLKAQMIPPRSVFRTIVEIPKGQNLRHIFTPVSIQMKRGLYVREGILPNHQLHTVEIVNPTLIPIKLHQGMTVGLVENIENDIKEFDDNVREKETFEYNETHKNVYDQIDKIDFKTDSTLNDTQIYRMKQFLKKHAKVIATDPKNPGQNLKVKHKIDTGESQPLRQRAHRTNPAEEKIIETEVETMLKSKTIKPSKSPWASPVVLVKKKDGSVRFCIDYRRLNVITKKDVYPMPRIDDTLDKLIGMKFFTTLDLASGYWQVEVDEKDKEKTPFFVQEDYLNSMYC